MDLAPEILAALIVAAMAAGFVDAIAGGGGLITLPALLAAGVPPVPALATNKLQSVFGTTVAAVTYARAGHLDLRAVAPPAGAAFAGSAGGAVAVQYIDTAALEVMAPVMIVLVGGYFLFARRLDEADRHRRVGPIAYSLIAAAIGFYDGVFGPGAGSFYTASLISLVGLGVLRATAQTKVMNAMSNLAALIVLAVGGHMLWLLGLGMAAGNIVGGRLGSLAAMRFGSRLIRPLLVIVSLALTARLLADPDNALARWLWG